MTSPETLLPPGFRFHPTDEELILHYLRNRAASVPCPVSVVAEVDIYKFDPWQLPAKAIYGDREWYFFSPRDRKYPNGVRPNRAAGSGYWKATGTDKVITAAGHGGESIGVKKALVFYKGRPPRGTKTNWIMHEYRLAETLSAAYNRPPKKEHSSMRLDDWVLCRIYNKSSAATGTVAATAAAADQEQEEYSNQEESAQLFPWHEDTQMNSLCRMPKTLSFCDLLDDGDYSVLARMLCDNPPLDMAAPASCPELGPLLGLGPFSSSDGVGISYLLPKLAAADSSASETESCRKRRKSSAEHAEEGDAAAWPTKKPSSSCVDHTGFFNQVEASPPNFNALSSSSMKQHMMFRSNLGLH